MLEFFLKMVCDIIMTHILVLKMCNGSYYIIVIILFWYFWDLFYVFKN